MSFFTKGGGLHLHYIIASSKRVAALSRPLAWKLRRSMQNVLQLQGEDNILKKGEHIHIATEKKMYYSYRVKKHSNRRKAVRKDSKEDILHVQRKAASKGMQRLPLFVIIARKEDI